MEYKTTRKAVVNGFNRVIALGYCAMQDALGLLERESYTVGTYGWNADIYNFGRFAICTGYRPFGDIHPSYELQKKYETISKKLLSNAELSHTKKIELARDILNDFICESLYEHNNKKTVNA